MSVYDKGKISHSIARKFISSSRQRYEILRPFFFDSKSRGGGEMIQEIKFEFTDTWMNQKLKKLN